MKRFKLFAEGNSGKEVDDQLNLFFEDYDYEIISVNMTSEVVGGYSYRTVLVLYEDCPQEK